MEELLKILFKSTFGEEVAEVAPLKAHASARRIFRLRGKTRCVVGVYNPDHRENSSFIYLSRLFAENGLPVPLIHAEEPEKGIYLEEDLGDLTLFDFLVQKRSDADPFPAEVERAYEEVLSVLPRFQVEAGSRIDFSKTYYRDTFSGELMLKDMFYFRDQFLEGTGAVFDRDKLGEDFNALAAFLRQAPDGYFLYRDFQSRNIMLKDGKPFFIDYQSGCQGALQYDLASLLFQAQARIPPAARGRLLDFYLKKLAGYIPVDQELFRRYFYGFVYLRSMQVLGTYGLKGLKEGKQYFLDSIKYALENLRYLLDNFGLPVNMPEFRRYIESIGNREPVLDGEKLTLSICSFSYKQEQKVPFDQHGGGFVFDCRCLPNPGREEAYKYKSGLDQDVTDFLEGRREVQDFYNLISLVVDQAVTSYIGRKFSSLSVAFGCTGGQHRSVYLTEKLAAEMHSRFDINVKTEHLNRDNWLKKS